MKTTLVQRRSEKFLKLSGELVGNESMWLEKFITYSCETRILMIFLFHLLKTIIFKACLVLYISKDMYHYMTWSILYSAVVKSLIESKKNIQIVLGYKER